MSAIALDTFVCGLISTAALMDDLRVVGSRPDWTVFPMIELMLAIWVPYELLVDKIYSVRHWCGDVIISADVINWSTTVDAKQCGAKRRISSAPFEPDELISTSCFIIIVRFASDLDASHLDVAIDDLILFHLGFISQNFAILSEALAMPNLFRATLWQERVVVRSPFTLCFTTQSTPMPNRRHWDDSRVSV